MSFESILNAAPSEVERPRSLPVGSYHCIIKGLFRQDKSPNKGTEFAEFTFQFLSAGPDVDEEALDTALTKPSGEKVKLQEKTIKYTLYVTEDTKWRVKDFITNCGIDLDDHETLLSALNQTPNCQLGVYLRHKSSADGTFSYAEVGRTFKIED